MATRKLALITGASAGIGLQFAEFLAELGFDLVIVARRRERIEEISARLQSEHGVDVIPITMDLSARAAPGEIMDRIETEGRSVDVLVNNAGYALARSFRRNDWSDIEEFLEVLAIGQLELMHRVLPGMRKRGYGRILNIASLAAFAPEYSGGLYTAVKKFLVSASRAVWLENRGSGVHVTAVCPGYTRTEFHDVLGNREEMNKLPGFMWQSSDAVVRAGWSACEQDRPLVVTGIVNKLVRMICHLIPTGLIGMIAPRATKRARARKTR